MESSRYRRSVVPRIPSRRSTPSPNKESPAPGERPASTQPADGFHNRISFFSLSKSILKF